MKNPDVRITQHENITLEFWRTGDREHITHPSIKDAERWLARRSTQLEEIRRQCFDE